MGLFKKSAVKQIHDGAWGHLVSVHNIDVDTLSREIRCVERDGALDDGRPVTFLRVFKPREAEEQGVVVTGWETFEEHSDLILFEGYLLRSGEAYLERRVA